MRRRHGPLADFVRIFTEILRVSAIVVVAVLVGLLMFQGCTTGGDEARETLSKSGFYDIRTGSVAFGCAEGDKVGRGFSAMNANKVRVEGVVCCGVLKGCTVRF